jgi:N utilization substance protein A
VVEAAGDTLNKLQMEPAMATLAEAEAGNVPHIDEILRKKSEGRPLTPEEYTALGQFVDRVERRTIERQRVADAVSAEKLAEARAGIPDDAFEQPLDVLGLPEHVFNILTEAEYRSAGDLLLAMRLDSDKVLGLPGIGPKAMKAIETAVTETKFKVPVTEEVPAPVAEALVEAAPVEAAEVVVVAAPETTEEKVEAEVVAPVAEQKAEEEESTSTTFEELFKLRPEVIQPTGDDDADKKDKKGKKGKKSVEYQYDEDRGEVVGRKKHKRGDGEWETEF